MIEKILFNVLAFAIFISIFWKLDSQANEMIPCPNNGT